MKKKKGFRIWQIIYPIALYYVISSIAYYILEGMLGGEDETYMLRQLICSTVTIPFMFKYYRDDKEIEYKIYGTEKAAGNQFTGNFAAVSAGISVLKKQYREILLSIVSMAALGIAVNNILAMTPFMESSEGFQTANEAFFAGQLAYELLGSCLLIPIAEEVLFRGLIYKRLKNFLYLSVDEGSDEKAEIVVPSIIVSAVIFGIVHANTVQFVYATILGLLLAFILEKTNCLYLCVIGHIAANAAAVIRQYTGVLDFAYEPTVGGIAFTVLMAAVAAVSIGCMVKEYLEKQKKEA